MDRKSYFEIKNQLEFRPNNSRLVGQLATDTFLIALAGALLASRTIAGFVVVQPLLACLYFRGFAFMHDAVHHCVSRNARVNDWLGVAYGGLCFLPFTTWRAMHLEHHAWAGNFERDPVMRMVRGFPKKSSFEQALDTLLWRSWIPYIAFLQEAVFWTVSTKMITERKAHEGKRVELVLAVLAPVAVMATLVTAGIAAAGAWWLLAPSVVIYLVMVEVINLPHHLCLPRLPGTGKLSLWNQYKVSRTCLYFGGFSQFVLMNFNYHAEHHMYPTLPWYELPKAHALVRARGMNDYNLCDGFAWIRQNRNRNLRDVFAPTEALAPDHEREAA